MTSVFSNLTNQAQSAVCIFAAAFSIISKRYLDTCSKLCFNFNKGWVFVPLTKTKG